MRHLAYITVILAILFGGVSCTQAQVEDPGEIIEEEDPQSSEENKLQLSTKSSELVKIGILQDFFCAV